MNASRRLALAVAVSLLAHAALLTIQMRQPLGVQRAAALPPPLTVQIVPREAPADAVPTPAPREPVSAPRAPAVAPRAVPKAIPKAPPAERREEAPPEPTPAPQEPPAPAAAQPPAIDMLAMIEQRREQRRRQAQAQRPPVVDKPDALARNLQTLTGTEGVSGVFQILRKGTRTGEFAFNGWRQDARGRWREVIEVDAGLGGNIELAMVRRMIELIRSHYSGDFQWESHRLGRVVTLSARPEDNEGLEDFLMREFWGQPVLNPRR